MGEITQVAHLTEDIHPGVINAAYGWWFPETEIASDERWLKSNLNVINSIENLGRSSAHRISRESPVRSEKLCDIRGVSDAC
jgi:anaerobic selenocysteine-containing dehydrogenase